MFDTSCPSRDDPLKEYSILFSNKLNTQEFLYCAMKKYGSVHLSWNMRLSPSIFLCFNTSISNDRPKITDFMGEKQTPLNPPDRSTTISLNPQWNERSPDNKYDCMANHYPQSIVRSRECCREKMNVFMTLFFMR